MVCTTAQKSPNIWANFVIKFVAKKSPKSPNLVTLMVSSVSLQKMFPQNFTIFYLSSNVFCR